MKYFINYLKFKAMIKIFQFFTMHITLYARQKRHGKSTGNTTGESNNKLFLIGKPKRRYRELKYSRMLNIMVRMRKPHAHKNNGRYQPDHKIRYFNLYISEKFPRTCLFNPFLFDKINNSIRILFRGWIWEQTSVVKL